MIRHYDRWRVGLTLTAAGLVRPLGRTQSLSLQQAKSVLTLLTHLAHDLRLDATIRWPTGWSHGGLPEAAHE